MKACTRTDAGIIESIPFFTSYSANRKESEKAKYLEIQQVMNRI